MNRRRGISLVEMLIVIGTSSMILLAGVGMLHLLMRSERSAAESLVHATNHARLSAQFRNDVHAATTASVDGPPGSDQKLQLVLVDRTQITYSQKGRTLLRSKTGQAQPAERDQFRLPPDVRVRYALHDAQGNTLAELNWERSEAESPAQGERFQTPGRRREPLRIEAIVGKHHRYREVGP